MFGPVRFQVDDLLKEIRDRVPKKERVLVTTLTKRSAEDLTEYFEAAGVKVYEQPGMSHAKVSLVDGVASVGSLNMTRRAMLWDHELMLASDEKPFVAQIENLFNTDFGRSTQVTEERANSAGAKVGEFVRKTTRLKW